MRPNLILLVGVPGSGKTTYAQSEVKYSNCVHISSDAIRKELYRDENIQGNPGEIFPLMQKRTIQALNNGHDVLYDATNMTRKDRAGIISACPKFVKITARVIWAPIDVCIKRDKSRERHVEKEVIDKMLKRFQFPYYDEGIDEIEIILPQDFNKIIYIHDCYDSMNIPHDNKHHSFGVLEHCKSAYQYAREHGFDYKVCNAALIHDVGKPYVKAFVNAKGEPSDMAHYYQHQCVSAWIACGITQDVYTLWLISTHMDPYLNTKYHKCIPDFMKKDLEMLHEADINAH